MRGQFSDEEVLAALIAFFPRWNREFPEWDYRRMRAALAAAEAEKAKAAE
jgi:hypothetical protein